MSTTYKVKIRQIFQDLKKTFGWFELISQIDFEIINSCIYFTAADQTTLSEGKKWYYECVLTIIAPVVSIELFWCFFMPLSYNGVYYQPTEVSYPTSPPPIPTFWAYISATVSPAQRNATFIIHWSFFD